MKVFFTASQCGQKFYDTLYKKIFAEITRLGHTHLYDKIIKVPYKKFYENLESSGHTASVALYQENIKHLKKADINVFECSLHSLSIGFLVQKSLEFHKPTVVLYLKENTPYFLTGIKDEKLIFAPYNNIDEIPNAVSKAFEKAGALRDKRFNFFLSDEFLRYLEEASRRAGLNKSTFLRNLVLEHMEKNKR